MTQPKCVECRYWEQQRAPLAEEYGWCHRYPPRIIRDRADDTDDFPTTLEEDWCGEFQEKQRDGRSGCHFCGREGCFQTAWYKPDQTPVENMEIRVCPSCFPLKTHFITLQKPK